MAAPDEMAPVRLRNYPQAIAAIKTNQEQN
jgi:hypothetical protein